MVDSGQERGSSPPLDEDSPDPGEAAQGGPASSKVEVGQTDQGRHDVSRRPEGTRVLPVAGALAGVAALGGISSLVRRRRAKLQADIREKRRRRAQGALCAGALSAVLGRLRTRSGRSGR